jgi:serine/threonine protein kinase
MINSNVYDARIDIWSVGVLIFEMANGNFFLIFRFCTVPEKRKTENRSLCSGQNLHRTRTRINSHENGWGVMSFVRPQCKLQIGQKNSRKYKLDGINSIKLTIIQMLILI